MDNSFLYELKVDSNLEKVNRQFGSFISNTAKISAGLSAIVGGASLVANKFRDIDAVSNATGESALKLREVGQQFRLIGFEADKGTELVANLSKQIRDFTIGEGQFEVLGRLGIDASSIRDAEDFINQLRSSAQRDIETFRRDAPSLGLDISQIRFLTQSQSDFETNRQLAKEQIKNTQESIENAKEFNRSLAGLKSSFDELGQSTLKLGVQLIPLIEATSKFISAIPDTVGNIKDDFKTVGDFVGFRGGKGLVEDAKLIGETITDLPILRQIKDASKFLIDTSVAPITIGRDMFNTLQAPMIEERVDTIQNAISDNSETKNITNNINIQVDSVDDGNRILEIINEASR